MLGGCLNFGTFAHSFLTNNLTHSVFYSFFLARSASLSLLCDGVPGAPLGVPTTLPGVCSGLVGVVAAPLLRVAAVLLGVLIFLDGEGLSGSKSSSDSTSCRRRLLGVIGCAVRCGGDSALMGSGMVGYGGVCLANNMFARCKWANGCSGKWYRG